GEFAEALVHAEQAVQQARTRFEVLASRIDILIELEQFDRALAELSVLDDRFRVTSSRDDIRFGIRAKLLIREQKWQLAEQVLSQTTNRQTPHYQGLRLDILAQKIKDPTVSPGEREVAIRERDALARQGIKRVPIVDTDT